MEYLVRKRRHWKLKDIKIPMIAPKFGLPPYYGIRLGSDEANKRLKRYIYRDFFNKRLLRGEVALSV